MSPFSLNPNDKNDESESTRNLKTSSDDKLILEKHKENEEDKHDDNMKTSTCLQNIMQQNTNTKLRGDTPTTTNEGNKSDSLNNNTTMSDTSTMKPQILQDEHHCIESSLKEKGEVLTTKVKYAEYMNIGILKKPKYPMNYYKHFKDLLYEKIN